MNAHDHIHGFRFLLVHVRCVKWRIAFSIFFLNIKWDCNPNDKLIYMKELYKPWILLTVSSKSVEKWESCGCLNMWKWTVMEAAILSRLCDVTQPN